MNASSTAALQVTRRLFALDGEARINLLRVLAVTLFYVVHLVNRSMVGMSGGPTLDLDGLQVPIFDTAATALTIAWAGMSGAVLILLRTTWFRRAAGTTAAIADVVFLCVLLLLGNGPTSPLVFVLFLPIAASGLRGQRVAVWLTTVACLAAYGTTVAYATYRPEFMPPRYHILVVAVALGMMGVVVDLVVGAFWRAMSAHAATVARVASIDPTLLEVPHRTEPCPWCATPVAAGSKACGRCEQPLVPSPAFSSPEASVARRGSVYVVWAVSAGCLVVVTVAIGIGLALQWPALLVPYVGAASILLLGLGRIIQLDLRADADDPIMGQAATAVGTAAATVALGATALALLLGLALLMAVAAAVIAVALCFAVVAGASAG